MSNILLASITLIFVTQQKPPNRHEPPLLCMIRTVVSDPLSQDAADLAEEARRLLIELDRDVPVSSAVAADCRPPIDVFETTEAVEDVVDVPGVAPELLRVAIRRDTVLVVGVKLAPLGDPRARFHLAERAYGHFARAI